MAHDPDSISSNPSGNPALSDMIAARVTRRTVLTGGLGAAAVGFLAGSTFGGRASAGGSTHAAVGFLADRFGASTPPDGAIDSLLGFTAVPTSTEDTVVVPDGYTVQVLVPWGQPIRSDGPEWRPDATNTADEQAEQVGQGHDGMFFYAIDGSSTHGLLVLNHEYIDRNLTYAEGIDGEFTEEMANKALEGHGVTVVEIELVDDEWVVVDSDRNRRISGTTPVDFSGPVTADHPALESNDIPRGTLNNCGSGLSLWGTYLACEENFNGYFGANYEEWSPSDAEARIGVDGAGWGYRWHEVLERFDLAANPGEFNRFGWVVEIDPYDPESTPVKRTALGRRKHESIHMRESADGRAIAYTGDDQDGEYLYKFVSANPWQDEIAAGNSPLDDGTLYVARFNDDGTGEWLPLAFGEGPLIRNGGFADQADVLINTRAAADAVGATRLDRPEWITENPRTGDMFLTCTNGSNGPNPANPRNPNPYGHIVRWVEDDPAGTDLMWDVFILAGDPAYDDEVDLDADSIFGSPDGLWGDPNGILWIQTDISNSAQNLAERGYDNIGNNAQLACDPETGEIRRFLTGPRGCEITGVHTTPDGTSMFVNVQHPGESTAAWGEPTPDDPTAVSSWPDGEGRPRAACVVVRRTDGGVIGVA